MSERVVLVPGLWMPAAAMALLAGRLHARGYAVQVFPYSGRKPFEANLERLARLAREGEPAHFVGHSLGGVLIFDMLARHEEVAARSALLLGAPVRGSHTGRKLGAARVGRWMMGACAPRWTERAALWKRAAPLGIIAASVPVGLGLALGRMPGVNDGVVSLHETDVEGATARALVATSHTGLIVSGRAARLIERFLAAGRFE